MALRLLIADDDALARALIEAIVARDGDLEAVLDWVMPGRGGETAAREILQCSPDTRIVALTPPDTACPDVAMARTTLVKGSPPEELLRTIRAAAEN